MRQALAAERAGGPTEEAEHPSATARTIRASPEDETGPTGPPGQNQLKHPDKGVLELKSNLISAIAGWKSAALLALVAMVAAVAFSGVLTNTQTADAQAAPASAPPGTTVVVSFVSATSTDVAAPDRFRISRDSDGSATFSNGAQSISCTVDSATGCDASTDGGIQLRVTIDDDSALGQIFVQYVTRVDGEFDVSLEHAINVIPANPPVAIRAYGAPAAASLTAAAAADGTLGLLDGTSGTLIGSQLVNARGAGIASTSILVTTTRGVLNSDQVPTTTPPTTCVNVSACTLTTQAEAGGADNDIDTKADNLPAGRVQVRLSGNGATGNAVVTFRELATGLTREVTVVLHGPAASISAEVDQGTIGIGGSTFVVVTVLDADGNPAVGVQDVSFRSNKPLVPAIVGPEVPAGSAAVLLDQSLVTDRLAAPHPLYLPSCGQRDAVAADSTATPPVAAVPGSDGTNTAGKCVIQVTAAGGDTPTNPADDSTRGTHTLTVGTSNARIPTVNVEVQVGGAPASLETDAPARVDALSSTKITVTVLDNEGVRVGAVPITVDQVEGSGQVDDVATGMTSDGRGSFTYLAPLSSGEAVFLVRVYEGTPLQIQTTITLAIGPAPVEAPDAPPATWNNALVSGTNTVVWNGADGADPSDGAADGVSAIWQYNSGTGTWDGYFPDAADVPGGNTLTSLESNQAYTVIVD